MPNDQYRESYLRIIESCPLIDGRFENPTRIDPLGGSGNFSLVFRVADKYTGKPAILKFFHPIWRRDEYRWKSFEREADLLARLRGQKDIIEMVASRSEFSVEFEANGVPVPLSFSYYAVEPAFCDVARALNNAPVSAVEALELFHPMCRAVQRIRTQGIAHRDLAPRNFLLMETGEVKLSDFGTARYCSSNGIVENYVHPPGDVRYCPPEMLACLHDELPEIAMEGDVYALGAILFELFTGTNLGAAIMGTKMLQDLVWMVSRTKRGDRKQVFDGTIAGLAAAYPLPRMSDFGSVAPRSVAPLVEDLYRSLCAFDYRARQKDFDRIFLKIRSSLIVLKNSESYERWQREKQRRREAVRAKAAVGGRA